MINSERNYECIDFIIIIISRNNASISNFGGGFRWKNEYPWCKFSKKLRKTKKKNNFFAKPVFDQIDFFYMVTTEIFDFYDVSRRYLKILPCQLISHNSNIDEIAKN
ncbi:Uncharacterized protein FWK35_00020305 [Aphis craccivora]|uniref:Uncharacterized protein n=1 Tax=Aphis craccivora TaxID=307492 RepID=A0A6G0WBG9_APHCR|nr:Uncharacterized protein FWK35_00020305 [Aphis craccivora]